MKSVLTTWCTLAAAIVVAAAGIFEVIDQTSMIILIVVLTVCVTNGRGSCTVGRRT